MSRREEELLDHLETAWGVIANAWGGDWERASPLGGWKVAAERWRDRWHELLEEGINMLDADPKNMTEEVPVPTRAVGLDRTNRESAERDILTRSRRSENEGRVSELAQTVLNNLPMKMDNELAHAWQEIFARAMNTASR